MTWHRGLGLAAVALIGALSAGFGASNAAVRSAPLAFKPAIPQEQLMDWTDRAFGQMKLAIAKEEQKKAENHAYLLAELANVNVHHKPDDAKFGKHAQDVRDAALELAKLVSAGDYKQAKTVVDRVAAACTACHDAYRSGE